MDTNVRNLPLLNAFDRLRVPLDERIQICASKIVPEAISQELDGNSVGGDTLASQCDHLLPALLKQHRDGKPTNAEAAATRDDDRARQAAWDKERKKAAAARKRQADLERARLAALAEEEKRRIAHEEKTMQSQENEQAKQNTPSPGRKDDDAERQDRGAVGSHPEPTANEAKEAARTRMEEPSDHVQDKRKAEAAKRKKENDDRKRKEEAEQQKKEKHAAEKKKEAERLMREAATMAENARREEEKRKEEERNTQTATFHQHGAEENGKAHHKKEKKQQQRWRRQRYEAESDEEEEVVWDEETGQKRRRALLNERSYVEDPCCGKAGSRPLRGCRCFAFFLYLVVFPAVYAGLVWLEFEAFGWSRVAAHSHGVAFSADTASSSSSSSSSAVQMNQFGAFGGEGGGPPGGVLQSGVGGSESGAAGGEVPHDVVDTGSFFVWGLPMVGLAFGAVANIVPVAPGLVLMPLFEVSGVTETAANTLALSFWVQVVGSGLFGFVSWCGRDARIFVCRALFLLPVFADLGYLAGVTKHVSLKDLLLHSFSDTQEDGAVRDEASKSDIALLHTYVRIGFAVFMVFMSCWVLIGVCIGGVNRYCCPSRTGGAPPGCQSFCQWIIVLLCAFNTGWLFIANIGCGLGVTAFFTLSLFLGVETKRALPTAVVVGAWALFLPALLEWIVLESFPFVPLLLVVPGLWVGSLLAPWFSKCGGPMCDLSLFFLTLVTVGTVVTCFAAIAIDHGKEDVEIGTGRLYTKADFTALLGSSPEKPPHESLGEKPPV